MHRVTVVSICQPDKPDVFLPRRSGAKVRFSEWEEAICSGERARSQFRTLRYPRGVSHHFWILHVRKRRVSPDISSTLYMYELLATLHPHSDNTAIDGKPLLPKP